MAKIPVRVLKNKQTLSNGDYYKKWGKDNNIDIGCGPNKQQGFIGVDIRKFQGVDIVHDLNILPWPVESGFADLLIASHILEHVDDAVGFMCETHRILKEGGKAVIRYPHYSQRHAFTDPTHKRFMTLDSLDFFIQGAETFGAYSDIGFRVLSKILEVNNDVGYRLGKLGFEAYEKHWCKLFPAWQVIVELEKI